MLEKYFKKDKKDKVLSATILIIIAIAVIYLGANYNSSSDENKTVVDANVTELLSNINDNYTVSINVYSSQEKYNYNYSRDSQIEILDEGDYSNKAYLVYKNKFYLIDVNNFKLTNISKIERYNNPYVNIELIKKIINNCELEYVNDNKQKCVINVNDYFKEYNSIYNTDYSGNENMTIEVSFYPSRIHSIKIDYTGVDKIINNGNDILKYELVFSDIGENNYTEVKDHYKNLLK